MKRIILTAITVDSDASDADLVAGIEARLGEFYPTDDGYPLVPADVRVSVTTPEVAAHIGGALWVGLGNENEIGDAALTATHALNLDGSQSNA